MYKNTNKIEEKIKKIETISNKPRISFTIDEVIFNELQEYCREKAINRSFFIEKAIKKYLNSLKNI